MNININEKELHFFWVSKYQNFYHEQPKRFEIVKGSVSKGDLSIKNKKDASLFFCEGYLNAKIVQSFYKRKRKKAIIAFDLEESDLDTFIVIVEEKFG